MFQYYLNSVTDRKNIKHIINGTVKIVSFLLVLALLLHLLSVTAFSKKGATQYKHGMNKAYSFLTEPDNTVDVLAIGNSDLYSAFVPAELWTAYGYTATVVASPHQTPLQSYEILKTFYKKQHPSVVIIEMDMLYDEALKDKSHVKGENTLIEYIFSNFDSNDFDEVIKHAFSVFMFHDRWKHAGKPNKHDTPNSHGYKYSERVRRVYVSEYMKDTRQKERIKAANSNNLKKIVAYCREQGSTVFFTEIPTLTSWDMPRHNAAQELASELQAEFVDLNLLIDDVGLNIETSFRDKGNHLNYTAACKVTNYLGAYIASHFNIADKRGNPDYAFFERSIQAFYEEVEEERIRHGKA